MDRQEPIHAVRSLAEIATPNAGRYLQQLCKHFRHKRPTAFDARSGQIGFSAGDCRVAAQDGVLQLSLDAVDREQLTRLQDVVVRHLFRFAFRETLQIAWRSL